MPLSLVHGVKGFGRFVLFIERGKPGATAYNGCLVTHLGLQIAGSLMQAYFISKREKKGKKKQTHTSKLFLGKQCFSVLCEQFSNAKLSEINALKIKDQNRGLLVIAFVVSIRNPVLPLGLDQVYFHLPCMSVYKYSRSFT